MGYMARFTSGTPSHLLAVARGSALLAAAYVAALPAPAGEPHSEDLWIGRSAAGQLKLGGLEEGQKPHGFNPAHDTALLLAVGSALRTTDPGFDGNVAADPADDFFPLEEGALIRLEQAGEFAPAFRAELDGVCLGHCPPPLPAAGGAILLGGAGLHRHVRFTVDGSAIPPFDPLRITWSGVFRLIDKGATGYAPSAPFTLYFSPVECVRGDASGDGAVNFDDIDGFVATLVAPEEASVEQRCAADVNRDGYADFGDIDAFVAALAGG